MRIETSQVALSAKSEKSEADLRQESMRAWVGNQQVSAEQVAGGITEQAAVALQISERAKAALQAELAKPVEEKPLYEISDADKQKLLLIQKFIENLTGKKIKFYMLDKMELKVADQTSDASILRQGGARHVAANQPRGWGFEYHSLQRHVEEESMQFSAKGQVKTADGRQIDFNLEVGMSRSFMTEQRVDIRAGDALKDPLVINYGGAAASLSEEKYHFDLDSDGNAEQMSFVSKGSGFLALDLNNDGKINNGKELFGPQSGSGFNELKAYDGDGNGWIDENDPIYNKLRIWTKDQAGQDRLLALGQAGVGAIYLGNVASEFSHKDSENKLQGQVRSSGVFLREDGQVGSMQQVDLVV
ncbi:hypothetical protein [Azotosporobacter soli]|uniref:hypothetical protein n=1 Tax=Azotosporobacter soli TaxID=3055040 RepID=UPI0031FEA023